MKLYSSNRAPNPRRVRWVMAEKHINGIDIIEVDIFKGEHRTPDYRARRATRRATQCARARTRRRDGDHRIGRDLPLSRKPVSRAEPVRRAREVAVIEMWTRRAEMLFATSLMLAVRHGHPALAALETQQPAIAESNRAAAERALTMFDRRLGNSGFIAGECVTMADIVAFIAIDFARMIRFRADDGLASVARWMEAMRARPAAAVGA